jgi:hypothetical protein
MILFTMKHITIAKNLRSHSLIMFTFDYCTLHYYLLFLFYLSHRVIYYLYYKVLYSYHFLGIISILQCANSLEESSVVVHVKKAKTDAIYLLDNIMGSCWPGERSDRSNLPTPLPKNPE